LLGFSLVAADGDQAVPDEDTLQTAPQPATGPVPLIIDTDIFSDAGDVGALATAFGLQLRGEAKVVGIAVNTRTSRPDVATNSSKCVAAVAQFYGAATVPIGSDTPMDGTATNTLDFIGPCAAKASPSTPAPDTAVDMYRRALAAQPNASVVIASIGYTENLAALLASPADAVSPLTGCALVTQKVRSLVIMAGTYPSGSGENNLIGNPTAAQTVADGWPTKVVWSGSEVGDAVHTGNTVSTVHPTNSPVRVAYEAFIGRGSWIDSYDLTAVYHAIRPDDTLLTEVGPGTNAVTSTGANAFTTGAGNQYYLTVTDTTTLDSAIEALLDTLPRDTARPPLPPSTAEPVIATTTSADEGCRP
jgi:hypothetical protein